jgi:hypothetical protein
MTVPSSRSLGDIVATLTADTTPYLSCDDCFDQICAYVEKVAADPPYEHAAMERHLQACSVCADEAASILELISADAALRGTGAIQA